jgi:hypothetical protein
MSGAEWALKSERPLAWGIWEWVLAGPDGDRKLVWAPGQDKVAFELPSLLHPPTTVLVPIQALPVSPGASGKEVRKQVASWLDRLNATQEPHANGDELPS